MPVSKNRKKKTAPKTQSSRKIVQGPTWIRSTAELTLGLLTVIGFIVGLAVFWPRFTIEPSGPFEPMSKSAATFRFANTGLLPLRNFQPSLGICDLIFGPDQRDRDTSSKRCRGELGTKLMFDPWFRPWLAIDEKYDIAIEDLFKAPPLAYADIAISVTYNPWRLPVRLEKQFRFETRKMSDGKMYWFSKPID